MKQSVKIRDNVDTKGLWGSSLSGEWHIVTHFETFRMKEADSEFVMMHQCRMVSKSCLFWTMRRKTPDPFSMRTQCKRKRLRGKKIKTPSVLCRNIRGETWSDAVALR